MKSLLNPSKNFLNVLLYSLEHYLLLLNQNRLNSFFLFSLMVNLNLILASVFFFRVMMVMMMIVVFYLMILINFHLLLWFLMMNSNFLNCLLYLPLNLPLRNNLYYPMTLISLTPYYVK